MLGDSTQEPYLTGKTEIISKLRNLRNVDHVVSRKGLRAGSKESGSANPEKKVRGAEEGEADQKEPGIRAVGHNTVVGRDGVLSLGCPQESAGAGAQSPGEGQSYGFHSYIQKRESRQKRKIYPQDKWHTCKQHTCVLHHIIY